MTLLDLAGSLLGGGGQQAGNAALIGTVLSVINSHPGGLGGLLQAFEQQGLGGAVSSWVGNGANQPISPQQAQGAVGSQAIQEMAGKLGVSPQDASSVLAQLLPGVVDHLTPNGQLPAPGTNMVALGEQLLKGLLSK